MFGFGRFWQAADADRPPKKRAAESAHGREASEGRPTQTRANTATHAMVTYCHAGIILPLFRVCVLTRNIQALIYTGDTFGVPNCY